MLKEEMEIIGFGDEDALLRILRKFDPLIRHYAHKLRYEDAYTDLICDLIRILKRLNIQSLNKSGDGAIVSYIVSCVKRAYLKRLSKYLKERAEIPFSAFASDQIDNYEKMASYDSPNRKIESLFESKILTKYEREILKLLYIYEYSINEIARKNKVSRQTVNHTKLNALKKLKREIKRDENCE